MTKKGLEKKPAAKSTKPTTVKKPIEGAANKVAEKIATPKKAPAKPQAPKKAESGMPEVRDFPSVKKGDSNGYVTMLQTILKNRGYYTGAMNGKFDDKTLAAVKAFQKDIGMPIQNGSVGPKTWDALQKSTIVKVGTVLKKMEEPKKDEIRTDRYQVVIEGLTKFQAEILVKLMTENVQCRSL